MNYVYKTISSPLGCLKLVASEKGLAAILWENDDPRRIHLELTHEDNKHPVLRLAERQLSEYFAGKRKSFSLALDFKGTGFAGGLEAKARLLSLEGRKDSSPRRHV
jgi:methylated-DNA-[protein]-cysteine S-methyltransferase